MVEHINLQIKGAERTPNRKNLKTSAPRHIIIKLVKMKMFRQESEKNDTLLYYKGK